MSLVSFGLREANQDIMDVDGKMTAPAGGGSGGFPEDPQWRENATRKYVEKAVELRGRDASVMATNKKWRESQKKFPSNTKFKDFEVKEKLGEGTYGVVTKAVHKATGTIVAIKKVKTDTDDEGIPATAIREISLLKRLSHANIVLMHDVLTTESNNMHLVFEFVDEDLHKFLCRTTEQLDPETIRSFVKQLLLGMDCFHSNGVLHRDLKPQNILITTDFKLKIADLGLGREIEFPVYTQTHEVVTLWYRCPEVMLGIKRYAFGLDVWSIGTIIAELFSFKEPDPEDEDNTRRFSALFAGECEIDQIFKIFQVMGTPSVHLWKDGTNLPEFCIHTPKWLPIGLPKWRLKCPTAGIFGIDLVRRMLALDPDDRLSVRNALNHPFLTMPEIDDSFPVDADM